MQLAGGHIDANVNNPNENLGQWQAGHGAPALRLHAEADGAESEGPRATWAGHDIPTCKEAGLDVESYQMPRTVWLPAACPTES